MRRIIGPILLIVPFTILVGCLPYFGKQTVEVQIADASQQFEKRIDIEIPKNRAVYKRKVYVKGELNQKCILNYIEVGPGKIDTVIYNGDHYGTNDYVIYEPAENTKGHLQLELTFYY